MDRGGTSDPYVTLQLLPALGVVHRNTKSKDGGKQDRKCTTKVVFKNLNPRWDETFELLVSDDAVATLVVCVQVWDKDIAAADDLIGQFTMPLTQLLETSKQHTQLHPLSVEIFQSQPIPEFSRLDKN